MAYSYQQLEAERNRLMMEINRLGNPVDIYGQQRRNDLIQALHDISIEMDRTLNLERQQANQARMYGAPTFQPPVMTPQQQQYYNNQYPVQNYQNQSLYSNYQNQSIGQTPVNYSQPIVTEYGGTSASTSRYSNKKIEDPRTISFGIPNVPVQQPVEQPKVYTQDSLYPILCDDRHKEVETKTETGYIQRTVSGGIEPIEDFVVGKATSDIKSLEDLYDHFKGDLDKYNGYLFHKIDTYVTKYVSVDIDDDGKIKEELNKHTSLTPTELIKYLRSNIIDGRTETELINIRYTKLYNELAKYKYNLHITCDDIHRDIDDLKKAIQETNDTKTMKQFQKIFELLIADLKQVKFDLVYDKKYIKVKFRTPVLLIRSDQIYNDISLKSTSPLIVREYSHMKLFKAINQAYSDLGKSNKIDVGYLKLVIVNDRNANLKFSVYRQDLGEDSQYVIVPD